MHKILICRHSTRDIQPIDCNISQEGINIIDEKINDIKKLILDPIYIITSPYRRTIETAQCISAHYDLNVPIITENQIEEVIFHESQKECIGEPLKRFLCWDSDKPLENWNSVHERTKKYLTDIQKNIHIDDNKEYICVTHGGIINSMLTYIDSTYTFDLNNTNPHKYIPDYCEYIVIEITRESINVVHKSF